MNYQQALSTDELMRLRTAPEIRCIVEAEGGLHYDPDDPGGQTCCGIARKKHLNWDGWNIIDGDSALTLSVSEVRDRKDLWMQVEAFYKAYMDKARYFDIQSFGLAHPYLHQAINMGFSKATMSLQATINLISAMEDSVSPVKFDGIIGEETLLNANAIFPTKSDAYAPLVFATEWIGSYQSVVAQNPNLKKYFRGWINRVMHHTDLAMKPFYAYIDNNNLYDRKKQNS